VDAYDFSHDKLREVAYHGLSAARRRLLHHHVAQALEVLHGADLDPVSRQLAAHYDWAGLALQSARYYLRASGVARRVYANDEAIALLQRGLALVGDDQLSVSRDERGYELAAQLWEALGDILEQRAQHEAALQAYSNAKSHAPNRDRVWQARLLRKEGGALREQRLYANALAACHRAEVVLGEQPGEDTNPWWDEWLEVQVGLVWAHYWLAQWPEMEAVVHKIKPVVQERGKPASRAIFLWASCMMQLRRDHYVVSEGMLAEAREGLAASQELGNLKTIVEWNFELGFFHLWRRELDDALECLQNALKLVETAGFIMMRVLTLTYLTVLHRFQGQEEAVLSYAQQAYEAAEAAHMPDYIAAARGNQAWLAWRGQDLQAVERLSKEALVIWQQSPLLYPFQWQALWPLIAVSLARDREDDAWNFVQALLEPKQQHLPDPLYGILASAVQARAQEQVGTACSCLDQATGFARDMGYL
jgi:tetratricopeptide (TPR) repeat protein